MVVNVSTTSHLYHVPQAERCTEHGFMVRAVNPAGASNYSDPITTFIPDGELSLLYMLLAQTEKCMESGIRRLRVENWGQ